MIDIEKFPETWCRMWSEDATFAHELLTDDARQWATRTAPRDSVLGPAQTEGFISRYQVDVGNIFVPRALVVGTDWWPTPGT